MIGINEIIAAKAFELAQAVAQAEGFNVAGSLPNRIHNPGDMELGSRGYGVVNDKTVYAKADWSADINDKTDGCSALRRECIAILAGSSSEFQPDMTFIDFAMKWTGGDSSASWLDAVCEHLGVQMTMTLKEYVLAP